MKKKSKSGYTPKSVEQARKEKFDRSMKKAGWMILIGQVGVIIAKTVPYQLDMKNVISLDMRILLESLLWLISAILGCLGFIRFNGILRGPLDKEQAIEITKKDRKEMERLKSGSRTHKK